MVLRHIRLASLTVLFVFLSVGCGSTDTLILSENLSSDFQLRLNTVEQYETNFQFNPSPDAEKVVAESPRVGSSAKVAYSLNDPLEGKLTSLMRSKFGSLSQSSENRVTFSIESVTSGSNDEGIHKVGMTALIEIERGGETYQREVSRSTTVVVEQVDSAVTYKSTLDKEVLEEFIMQFVVATDSFIDSNFGVD